MALSEHQKRARRQELRTAAEFGGKRNAGSGNTIAHGNDVRTDRLSIETKTTSHASYRLSLPVLLAVERHALLDGREMVMIIDIQGREFAVITNDFFKQLIAQEEE